MVAIETNSKQSLNMAAIKAVTGCAPITVRNLYTKPITFRPQFKLMMATNQLPRISDQDHEVLTNPIVIENGKGTPPAGPGWGTDLDDTVLAEFPPADFTPVVSEPYLRF